MLFNSFVFIFGFFPVVLAGFYALTHFRHIRAAKIFLVLASLVFYGWFSPWIVLVLLTSLVLTYLSVDAIRVLPKDSGLRKLAFLFGLAASLGNLMFWKYADVAIWGFNSVTGSSAPLLQLVVPLGISFYTFQLLTFVLDAYAGRVKGRVPPLDFSVYAVLFPQLVVGPIVRYDEMLPQVAAPAFGKLRVQNLVVGLAIFVVGLAKKVILADNLALMVDPSFERVGAGEVVSMVEAWRGALAYTLQLYFDFSGYSDMAIGIARAFGLRLPINFHSPLRSHSTLDFWRRWHITLTRMTTTYVFSPISMMATRFAARHRIKGLMSTLVMVTPACLITFVLIGFWHAASGTFLLFGLLHTIYAVTEYMWRQVKPAAVLARIPLPVRILLARAVTLLLIVVSLALFRSPDVPFFFRYATFLFGGGDGLGTLANIDRAWFNILLLSTAFVVSQFVPNTQQLFARYKPGIFSYIEHARDKPARMPRLGMVAAVTLGFLFIIALAYIAQGRAEFLYFGF